MSAPGSGTGLFPPDRPETREPRSPLPWIIAGGVVILILAAIVFMSHRTAPSNPGGAGLAPPDPYAASLNLSNIQMSQANSAIGGESTYLDGQIANNGSETLTAITVQVAFRDVANQLVQKDTLPLNLIRTRVPYVDTEAVRADPILPRQTREFRLIFDHISQDWNQSYPEIRVIAVTGK
ncbi:MAG TPA: DUF2393 family protein [Acidobacteriaceae bacterium]|jgi:hypothetical protein|nr:DUF2393 family protein [Acidobacteriaceae bacterium]